MNGPTPTPPWTSLPQPMSSARTYSDPHSHLEVDDCKDFNDGDSEAEESMYLRPGMTIMACHHGRDASLSSLESWLSEIGGNGARFLDEPSQQQMPSATRHPMDRPPTELVLTQTVDRLKQQRQEQHQQQKLQETRDSSEEEDTAAASWMAAPQILACSSPEIRALCSKSSFASQPERLPSFKTDDYWFSPPSSGAVVTHSQRKSFSSASSKSTTSTGSKRIPDEIATPVEDYNKDATSLSSSCHQREDDRIHTNEESLCKMPSCSNESDTTSSTSATTISLQQSLPPTRMRKTIPATLPHTATAVRRPSLHRRISYNTLPPMDQVLQQPPRRGSHTTATTTTSSSRLYQHRRNTTQFSLPSSTYLK